MKTHLAALAILTASPAVASDGPILTASGLLDACTRPTEAWISFCNGFFQAVHDIGAAEGRVCIPPGTTRTDLVVTFEAEATAILKAAPSMASIGGARLAELTLEAAYPCH